MRPASSSRIAALLLTLSPLALGGAPHDEISFSCMTLTTERTDPIMNPGEVSSHTHLVAGGSGFQRTMEKDTAKNANATTCGVDIDRSNYWIPQLYHQMHNGHFEAIETENAALYYMNRACNYTDNATSCDPKHQTPLAPPPGLRILTGNPFLRTYNESDKAQQAVSHMCIKKDGSSNETKHLPREPCTLLRSQVFMPSCWDGKNIDSPDHISHMAYPAIGHYNKGVCPESHPVAIISIFYEFVFKTEPFPDYENWIYAMGDPTGYGLHGDFVNGWTDQDALQDALRTCTGSKGLDSPSCSITKGQKSAIAPQFVPLQVHSPKEEVGQNGPVPKLPGDNPIIGPRASGKDDHSGHPDHSHENHPHPGHPGHKGHGGHRGPWRDIGLGFP